MTWVLYVALRMVLVCWALVWIVGFCPDLGSFILAESFADSHPHSLSRLLSLSRVSLYLFLLPRVTVRSITLNCDGTAHVKWDDCIPLTYRTAGRILAICCISPSIPIAILHTDALGRQVSRVNACLSPAKWRNWGLNKEKSMGAYRLCWPNKIFYLGFNNVHSWCQTLEPWCVLCLEHDRMPWFGSVVSPSIDFYWSSLWTLCLVQTMLNHLHFLF